MRVTICAVGRLRRSPELDLVRDYSERFDRSGRQLGLGPIDWREVDDRKGGGQTGEAALLQAALPENSIACALDERGQQHTSPQFARLLSKWRDDGQSTVSFVIGGADGIAPDLRRQLPHAMSFGNMVWPHMLVRVMLAEQLYRAATILAGSPYHRG